MQKVSDITEKWQILIYFNAIFLAIIIFLVFPSVTIFENKFNLPLALMLFFTFFQIPITDLKPSFINVKFIFALLFVNFILIPMFVLILIQFLPENYLLRLGVLLVLLTPCIDYVITFSKLGQANTHLLLTATPILYFVQLITLPIFLRLILGKEASEIILFTPFFQTFILVFVIPFIIATLMQLYIKQNKNRIYISKFLGMFSVPITALVFFIITAYVIPYLDSAKNVVFQVIPIYIVFSVISPLVGSFTSRIFKLDSSSRRAIAFSAGTRNSLIVLPLALLTSNETTILPTIIMTQTIVELISELFYIRLIPKFA